MHPAMSGSSGTHDSDNFELIMPFITVASRGGPHDDDAYVCGFEAGLMDHACRIGRDQGVKRLGFNIHVSNLPQVDLIAMRYGYTTTSHVQENNPEWCSVTLSVITE